MVIVFKSAIVELAHIFFQKAAPRITSDYFIKHQKYL
jgi:hypothetical protein